jgi:ABC-type bacteriocin/lantibiotic exporter with double-glycine peptidase domain
MMKPVVQLEPTGCGIASVAAIAGLSYARAKAIASSLGISSQDERLWSETAHVRKLLEHLGVRMGRAEHPFRSWESLPDLALLSIKWHLEKGRPFWHWVVFVRVDGGARVLDPKKSLRAHVRTDFGRIEPKWFIPIVDAQRYVAGEAPKAARP